MKKIFIFSLIFALTMGTGFVAPQQANAVTVSASGGDAQATAVANGGNANASAQGGDADASISGNTINTNSTYTAGSGSVTSQNPVTVTANGGDAQSTAVANGGNANASAQGGDANASVSGNTVNTNGGSYSNLSGSCSVNMSNPEVGEYVTFSASASGGNGSYQYSWSGTDGLSSSSKNVSKRYNSEGTKNASVVITSGSHSVTRNCSVYVEEDQPTTPQLATITAHKIVCDDEADLPNWGITSTPSQITANTAEAYVASHSGCHLESGWKFQWAVPGTPDLPGDLIGEAGGAWNTAPQATNANGKTTFTIDVADQGNPSFVWVREVQKAGYIPFTYGPGHPSNEDTVSAEMYCNVDIVNFDNFDRVDNLKAGESFNCVAFNVKKSQSPQPTPNLSGSCSVNMSNPEVGEYVTFSASASGGNGSYQYSWSGTDGLSSSSKNVSKRYNSEGTKNASVVITSGSHSVTRNCSVYVEEEEDEDLQVTCSPDGDEYDVDERVTWQAFVTGGDGNYDYDWSGTDGFDGNSRTETIRYDDDGRKSATIEVTDGNGQRASDTCRIDIEEEDNNNDDFDISCEVSDTRIEEGDRVTFEVEIDGGDSPYDIEWDGDIDDIDNFDDNDRRQTVRIDDEGRYRIEVEVTDDDGRRRTDACPTIVVDEEDDDDNVSVTSTIGRGGQVAGVALSQVPYTGLTDSPILNAILYSLAGLTLLVIGSVSLFILRKREIVTVFAGSQGAQTGEISAADYTEDEIVSALEDAAHKKRVIVSSDAMETVMLRSKHNKVKALMLLNKAVTEAKKDISTDAWLVLSKQKIADVL